MKKFLTVLLAAAMLVTCVACGSGSNNTEVSESDNAGAVEIKDANDILTKVWDEYKATEIEDNIFPVCGGGTGAIVEDSPAAFDLTAEGAEVELSDSYCFPEGTADKLDDAATMKHLMNANTFSAAAYHVTDAAEVEGIVNGIKDATLNHRWMCGFPEKMFVVTIGEDYVVSGFGLTQQVDSFTAALKSVYGDAAVFAVEENVE